jgi:hypothetical protein
LLRDALKATGTRQQPGWRYAKQSLLVARMQAAKVRTAVKCLEPIRFAKAGANVLIVVGVGMERRGLRRRCGCDHAPARNDNNRCAITRDSLSLVVLWGTRRILGIPLQWNDSDQKSRANGLEQRAFEASPGG